MKIYSRIGFDRTLRKQIDQEAQALSELFGFKISTNQLIVAIIKDFLSNPKRYKKFIIDL